VRPYSGPALPQVRAPEASAADLEVAALRWGLPLVEMADLKTWL
jgi:hypothetical protein